MDIIPLWKPTVLLLSSAILVDGVRLKGRLPVIPRERNGGVYIALAGNLSEGVRYITSAFFVSALGVFGAIASIVSLALYLRDRKKK